MIIKRNINGIETEIRLTDIECRDIYEQLHQAYIKEDIQSRYNVDDDDVPVVIERFDKALGRNDGYWDHYWGTLEYVCNEMGFTEREEYN